MNVLQGVDNRVVAIVLMPDVSPIVQLDGTIGKMSIATSTGCPIIAALTEDVSSLCPVFFFLCERITL